MKIVKQITENEVVATILQYEINSLRFGGITKKAIKKDGKSFDVVLFPNLAIEKENKYRKNLLGRLRGYGKSKELFHQFPSNVKWYRAFLTKKELKAIKYINYSYWLELSRGSRRPQDGAKSIKKGIVVMNQPNKFFKAAAKKLRGGYVFPSIVAVGKDKKSGLIVLEGHLRLTAYMLEPDFIPGRVGVIVGFSPNIEKWKLF